MCQKEKSTWSLFELFMVCAEKMGSKEIESQVYMSGY